jgi:hypothetical protein
MAYWIEKRGERWVVFEDDPDKPIALFSTEHEAEAWVAGEAEREAEAMWRAQRARAEARRARAEGRSAGAA